MALDRITQLIEKYFEAQTSIAEEKELKDYFASSDVEQHLEQYKPLFGYAIHAKKEEFTLSIPLITESNKNKRKNAVWLSIAAAVTLLLGVGLVTFYQDTPVEPQNLGTIEDPEVAFRETQKALAMISESVNKGIGSMGYLNEYEQSKNKIFKK